MDVPIGLRMLGGELHTGGFACELGCSNAANGLNTHYLYTANGRLVLICWEVLDSQVAGPWRF